MKIYQLHEYSGLWEYFHDYIIGSYLRKERAEEELDKAKTEEEELREKNNKCSECPFLGEPFCDLDKLISEHNNYCSEKELEDSGLKYGICCNNYYLKWQDSTFEIKEVEVEE